MGAYTTEAIVTRCHLLGEADKIVTLISPDKGKFRVVAKGARRPKSRLAGSSEVFSYSLVHCHVGRSLDICVQMEVRSVFGGIREDLTRMAWASYGVELVEHALQEGQPMPAVFHALLDYLYRVDSGSEPEGTTRRFEYALLAQLGYKPQLASCMACGCIPVGRVYLSPSKGGILCSDCSTHEPNLVGLSQGTYQSLLVLSGGDDRLVEALRLTPQASEEIFDASNAYLAYYLERIPRSLSLIRTLMKGT